jgi:hypothetical protein
MCSAAFAHAGHKGLDSRLWGVWQGRRGSVGIWVCFDASLGAGRYVAQGEGEPTPLLPSGPAEFRQGDRLDAQWNMRIASQGRLLGTVTENGAPPLTLDLVSADAIGEPHACAAESMASAVETPVQLVAGPVLHTGDHRYRVLRFGWQKTLELLEPGASVAAVNQQLLGLLDRSPRALEGVYRVRRRQLTTDSPVGYDDVDVEPLSWGGHWLTVNFYRWAAGMGKSGISQGQVTWNLDTGAKVDLWSWFGGAQAYSDDPFAAGLGEMPPRLHALAFKGEDIPDASNECAGNYQAGALFQISLESGGMSFAQPPTGDGCDLTFTLSYAELLRVATPQGTQAIRRVLREGL